jgi:hypothetical protein
MGGPQVVSVLSVSFWPSLAAARYGAIRTHIDVGLEIDHDNAARDLFLALFSGTRRFAFPPRALERQLDSRFFATLLLFATSNLFNDPRIQHRFTSSFVRRYVGREKFFSIRPFSLVLEAS